MRKTKFNKFERIAGLFLLSTILGVCLVGLGAAIKQGWFDKKYYFTTIFENADGVHQGTLVQMSGLRAGAVSDVFLQDDNKIAVTFYILGKYRDRVRTDSRAQLIRPFVIGDRVLDVGVGSPEAPLLDDKSLIASVESFDLITMLSGKKLNNSLDRVAGLLQNLEGLVTAFLDKNRTESMVRIFDRLDPLLMNLNSMSLEMTKIGKQANKDQGVEKMMGELTLTLGEFNRILPELNRQSPHLAKDLSVLTQNLALMTKALGPALVSVEQDLPQSTKRLVEALDETVIMLKAMQKSIFMRANVEEVRSEEEKKRAPAAK